MPGIFIEEDAMGEMADYFLDQAMRFEDEETDYDFRGRKRSKMSEPAGEYHPFIWTRADGSKLHIDNMNPHHLGNAIRHLEKSHEGYPMPFIYFNMLKVAKKKGLGLTDDQINRLLEIATERRAPKVRIWKEDDDEEVADIFLKLEDDEETIALVACTYEGEQLYPILSISRPHLNLVPLPLPENTKLGNWDTDEIIGK